MTLIALAWQLALFELAVICQNAVAPLVLPGAARARWSCAGFLAL